MARFETVADLERMYPQQPRMSFNPQYYYLSEQDSRLVDLYKDSNDERDRMIVKLILDKANASYSMHCQETR